MLYPFANLLLLALALTGLWQLADAARSGHFFAEARRRWQAEAYLLGYDFSDPDQAQAAFDSGKVFEVCPGYVTDAIAILKEIFAED